MSKPHPTTAAASALVASNRQPSSGRNTRCCYMYVCCAVVSNAQALHPKTRFFFFWRAGLSWRLNFSNSAFNNSGPLLCLCCTRTPQTTQPAACHSSGNLRSRGTWRHQGGTGTRVLLEGQRGGYRVHTCRVSSVRARETYRGAHSHSPAKLRGQMQLRCTTTRDCREPSQTGPMHQTWSEAEPNLA